MAIAKTKSKPKTTKKTTGRVAQNSKSMKKHENKGEALEFVSNSAIDYLDVKLTPLCKTFLAYYLTPGQFCFQNALQSALKAGYSPLTARADIYTLLRKPDIQKIVKINEELAYKKLHGAALRALEVKQLRAFFNPQDFFEEKEVTMETKKGELYTKKVSTLKDLKDMTPEQLLCIDGQDVKGFASIPVYIMPDRGKELNDLIKLDHDHYKGDDNGDGDEETMEIIMERLTVIKTMRKAKDEISEVSGLIRIPKNSGVTEL